MKIAVVCAPQTFGCNTGMFSVDLAAWYFLRRQFPDADIHFLTLYPHKCNFGDAPFRYDSQDENMQRLQDSDLILYWGDFQHTLTYRQAVTGQLVKQGICSTPGQALEQVRRFLYLTESDPETLQKAVLYGGTFISNPADSFSDEIYANDLKRLIRFARRVWVREPFSAFYVNQIQGQQRNCAHGTDGAQLLRRDFVDYCGIKTPRIDEFPQKKLGVFIGRSHLDANNISSFILAIKASTQSELAWLNWGKPPFFMDRKAEFQVGLPVMVKVIPDEAAMNPQVKPPQEILAALLELDYVISDTYHICVNAWNFGIPAICLIDNSQAPLAVNSGSAMSRRDKRVAFYWTYNAAPFLLYSSDLSSEAGILKKAEEISSLLTNQVIIRNITEQMSQHVTLSEEILAQTLRDLSK